MRFLTLADFTRSANKVDIMSSIAEYKIPKGMVYAFSTRMNMSIFVAEMTTVTGTAILDTLTLDSAHSRCVDLGGSETEGEDMKNQIICYIEDEGRRDVWTIDIATGIITADAIWGDGKIVNCFYISSLNDDPDHAASHYPAALEIRAEAPAGQNLGIPIFSGNIDEIHANAQNSDLQPLRLDQAVLLPEGFVLAVKVHAVVATAIVGTELAYQAASTPAYKDRPEHADRIRIPYQRFALKDFPRDTKARILASMAIG